MTRRIMRNNLFLLFLITGSALVGIYLFLNYFGFGFIEASAQIADEDKTPPKIYEIKIESNTETSTIISWKTDEESDSMINYAPSKDYGVIRDPKLAKEHRVAIGDLFAPFNYYFRIVSSDRIGNQSISNDYTFQTVGEKPKCPKPAEEEEIVDRDSIPPDYTPARKIIQEIIQTLEDFTGEESTLVIVQQQLRKVAEEVSTPPVISGDYAKVEVGPDWAIVRWKTDKDANSLVSLIAESEWNADNPTTYRWTEGNPNEYSLDHEIEVLGLLPATTYHFQVSSESELGLIGYSEDASFKTKSILPEIRNLTISKVEENSATLSWSTNVPCSALIEYTNLDTGEAKLEGNTVLVTSHTVKLNNLIFDTYYSAVVTVENDQNEKTRSEPLTFNTTKDSAPPVISRINSESTLYPGSENRTQTIVSWETDEPSVCQFFYQEGLTLDKDGSSLDKEIDNTTKHVQVITVFKSATVYKFWIVCNDPAENEVRSDDYSMLTPSQEQSIIDLIIGNFESTFGWLKKK